MSPLSRTIFIAMSIALGLCIVGLAGGMAYDLFLVLAHHSTLESVLGSGIPFYKFLGALGVLGFALFLVFLLTLMSGKKNGAGPK